MIGKIIPSRKDGGDPGNLIEYLIFGKGKNRDNKLERYSSALYLNSPTQSHDDFIRDCIARKYSHDHSKDNMYHFVLSLTDKDKADDASLFESAKLALSELGLSDHAAALIVHRDTHLPHVHIAVDLVNPQTFQRVKRPSHDFARLAKVCRFAESHFGFTRARGHHAGDKAAAKELGQPEPPTPERASRGRKVRDGDAHNPGPSFQSRIEGNQQLQAIFKDAESWNDLQNRLSIYGQQEFGSDLIYRCHGSGAVLQLSDDEQARGKASLVHHSASLSKLERRFGPLLLTPVTKVPSKGGSTAKLKSTGKGDLWTLYEKLKADHRADKADIKAKRDTLKDHHKAEIDTLKKAQAADRRALLKSVLDHKARLKLDSARALKAAQLREALEIRQAEERRSIYQTSRFPSWREWLSEKAKTDPNAQKRLLKVRSPVNQSFDQKSLLADVSSRESAEGIEYRYLDSRVSVDTGKSIKVSSESDDAILINLRIAQSKFGSRFTINTKSIERYISIAAKNGIYIASLSSDQQQRWKAERETLFQKKAYRNPINQKSEDQYHHRSRMNQENQNGRPLSKSDVKNQLREMHLQPNQDNFEGRAREKYDRSS